MRGSGLMTEGLAKVSGQIQTIDQAKRILTILSYEEMDGKKCPIVTALKWSAGLDGKMQKLNRNFFTSFVYVNDVIEDNHYFAKPADWPVQQQQGKGYGNRPFTPKNDKLITMQSSLKVCASLFNQCTTPDVQDYEGALKLVYEKALEMTNQIMKDCGSA
jgi:hypothetical protein